MDREQLAQWLREPRRTWRWNDGKTKEGYEAVEVTTSELRYFAWSHVHERSPGESATAVQSAESFRMNGPTRPLPEDVETEVRAFLESNAP